MRPTRTASRFGVQMHYYRLTSDQWCVWPQMYWSNKRLGGSVLILKNNSNKTANNAKYSNCRGLNHATRDVSLQNLWSPPFWILSPLWILFLSILTLYKVSMIHFVHKVCFDVEHIDCMLFSRDNLKNFDTIMCLFDRFVNHVNCPTCPIFLRTEISIYLSWDK